MMDWFWREQRRKQMARQTLASAQAWVQGARFRRKYWREPWTPADDQAIADAMKILITALYESQQ